MGRLHARTHQPAQHGAALALPHLLLADLGALLHVLHGTFELCCLVKHHACMHARTCAHRQQVWQALLRLCLCPAARLLAWWRDAAASCVPAWTYACSLVI